MINLFVNNQRNVIGQQVAHAANKEFAIAGVTCFADSLVLGESVVLRIKFCATPPSKTLGTLAVTFLTD